MYKKRIRMKKLFHGTYVPGRPVHLVTICSYPQSNPGDASNLCTLCSIMELPMQFFNAISFPDISAVDIILTFTRSYSVHILFISCLQFVYSLFIDF
jgi:hypothetical protein